MSPPASVRLLMTPPPPGHALQPPGAAILSPGLQMSLTLTLGLRMSVTLTLGLQMSVTLTLCLQMSVASPLMHETSFPGLQVLLSLLPSPQIDLQVLLASQFCCSFLMSAVIPGHQILTPALEVMLVTPPLLLWRTSRTLNLRLLSFGTRKSLMELRNLEVGLTPCSLSLNQPLFDKTGISSQKTIFQLCCIERHTDMSSRICS